MEAFKTTQKRCDHLIAFGKTYLGDESWSMTASALAPKLELPKDLAP